MRPAVRSIALPVLLALGTLLPASASADEHPLLELVEEGVGAPETVESSTTTALEKIPDSATEELNALMANVRSRGGIEIGPDGTFAVQMPPEEFSATMGRVSRALQRYLTPDQIMDLGVAGLVGNLQGMGDAGREVLAGLAGMAALGALFDSDGIEAEGKPVDIQPGEQGLLLTIRGKFSKFGRSMDPDAEADARVGYKTGGMIVFTGGGVLNLTSAMEPRISAQLGIQGREMSLTISGQHEASATSTPARRLSVTARTSDASVWAEYAESGKAGAWTAQGGIAASTTDPGFTSGFKTWAGMDQDGAFGGSSIAATIALTGQQSLGMGAGVQFDQACRVSANASVRLDLRDHLSVAMRVAHDGKTGGTYAGIEARGEAQSSAATLKQGLKSLSSRIRVELMDLGELNGRLENASAGERAPIEREILRRRLSVSRLLASYRDVLSRYERAGGRERITLTASELRAAEREARGAT